MPNKSASFLGSLTDNSISDILMLTQHLLHADTPPWGEGHADFLAPLTALQILDLARTYLVSPRLEVLSKLCSLKQLDLSHTAIQGNTLRAVSPALKGLLRLDISYTPLVSLCPTRLSMGCVGGFVDFEGSWLRV